MKKLSSLLLVSLTFHLLHAQLPQVDLANGLQAWYPFHHSLESRITGSPSSLSKGAAWTDNRFGESEGALAFRGTDQHILIPLADNQMMGGNEYAISMWIQALDDNPGTLILKEGDYGVKWNGIGKPLTIYHGVGGVFLKGKREKWSSKMWYHIVVVARENKVSLYINGELDQSWEVKSSYQVEKKNIFIGYHPYFWGGFTGKIDDLAIYNRPLTDMEIVMLSELTSIPIESTKDKNKEPLDLESFLGTWQGVVVQPDNELMENYPFWLHLNKKGTNSLKGFTRIEVAEDNAYGVSKALAYISGDALNFEEIQILRQKNYLGYKWCKKYGNFQYYPEDQSLRGKWYADNCQAGGEVILYKTKAKFNYHDNRLSTPVAVDELVVKLQETKQSQKTTTLKLELDPIVFKVNQEFMTQASREYLKNTLLEVLSTNPDLKLNIAGHTDSVGDDQYNLSLSVKRAKRIFDYLVELGVPKKQLSYQGFGESEPIASNKTKEGRSKNRRVEFEVSL
ncbi:MAG: OmpA family protein [Bacteroidota bacterium]